MPARLTSALCAGTVSAALLLIAGAATAGGPLSIQNNGQPFLWNTAAPIAYRTDQGPLSIDADETEGRNRVIAMFDTWQNVASSRIRYARAGFINDTGVFTDGDVSTVVEYNAVQASCNNGTQNPIVYDVNGSIFTALGYDPDSIIGFAGPCATSATQIVSGQAMLNGLFAEDDPNFPPEAFDAAMIHEFGHFSGLDHSQINLGCLFGNCGTDFDGLPTMFPILLSSAQLTLATDDIAWISRLYPETVTLPTFASTHGTITGVVYFSDGESHVQFANVVARRVDAGGDEDRRIAASVVSGYKFRMFHGNPITNPAPSPGSETPDDMGLFEISVPAGDYMLEVESIHFEFVGGSSVGPGFIIDLPGAAPTTGPISVAAGATVSGVDIVLINTPPRFDLFESP